MGRKKKIIEEEAILKINLRNNLIGNKDFGLDIADPGDGDTNLVPGCNKSVQETSGRDAICTIELSP